MLNDLRYAVRMLAKSPGFTAVAVCSLGIGIGANSAIFSFADALLLRPLPVPQPSGVSTITPVTSSAFGTSTAISYPDYVDFRDRNRTFEGLVAFNYATYGFAPNPSVLPEMKFGLLVSGNFFHVLGVEPALGRGFRAEEDRVAGRDAVAVLGHDFWMSQFDRNASAVGTKIRLNGIEFTIVGVAPERFTGVDQYLKPSLYVPMAMASRLRNEDVLNKRDVQTVLVKGRLKPGVTNAEAQADLNSIAAALQHMYPKTDANLRMRVQTELEARITQDPPDAGLIQMLLLLAFCVLLVACANVAGLLLSRTAARAREIAVRLAIGAGRWQLLRQLFVENLLLAAMGAGLGIAVAYAGVRLFGSIPVPTDLPIAFSVQLDHRVLLFTLAVAVASTFLFGLTPALRSSRPDVAAALKARDAEVGGKRRSWGRNTLVSAQVAGSLVLLIISGILLQGFRDELARGPGFRTDHLYLMSFDSTLVHYNEAQRDRFYKQLVDRSRSTPGVKSAALAAAVPMSIGVGSIGIVPEGYHLKRGEQALTVFNNVVSDGYFQAMNVPLSRGRAFLDTDKADAPHVAVVNEHLAQHYWPNQDVIGKRFHLKSADGTLVQIVGIAKNTKYIWIAEPPFDFLYLPYAQNQQSDMTLLAESETEDASVLAPALRKIVHDLDPDMPVFDARTMHDLYTKRAVKTPNIIVEAVSGMGAMGLLLAVVGLYGLVAYSVSRRTREIGIRMAIGADRSEVLRMILMQGLTIVLAGTAVGLVLGIVARHLVGSMIVSSFASTNPLLLPLVSVPLIIIALLATYAPARRASRVDPMRALREE
ncbi:MAG: ABC transporter permease [Acidobacteriaceae bacterium]|nr:ABC transporter permease [Acidobacteriaceae bacterium]